MAPVAAFGLLVAWLTQYVIYCARKGHPVLTPEMVCAHVTLMLYLVRWGLLLDQAPTGFLPAFFELCALCSWILTIGLAVLFILGVS